MDDSTAAVFERIARRIDGYRDDAIALQGQLCAIPAISPKGGGEGEVRKAELVAATLRRLGIADVEELRAPDPEAACGFRPNLIATIPGARRDRALWVMSHLDVVPPGDLKNWHSDPYALRVDGDRVYGRGVEDNQQGLVGSICVARALLDEGVTPPRDLKLLFVADEETGSQFGIRHLLGESDPFGADDLILVPDGGLPDGSQIEVAEKGILWLKITVTGKQTHGSTPEKGCNAHRAAAHLVVKLERLRQRFPESNPVFDPPTSTFEPTKREANVPNINTIPGEDVFYMDCRVLPSYTLDAVRAVVGECCAEVEAELGVTTRVEVAQQEAAAPPTATDAPIVLALKRALRAVYGVEGRPEGIGGGTVAAHIRRHGHPVAVWARMDETMHGPDEYCVMANLLGDAKVMAHVLLGA